jgi:hypothetical protein
MRFLAATLLWLAGTTVQAQYWLPLSDWPAVVAPPKSDVEASYRWATSIPTIDWRVHRKGGVVLVEQGYGWPDAGERPSFVPKAGGFVDGRTARVEDGWLVGFNRGEFGAALYWFSDDGGRNYKISDHQVVAFIASGGQVRALEGLHHSNISRGSLIRIAREGTAGRWRADTLSLLPQAPRAFSTLRDGTLLVTLTDALVALSTQDRVEVLVSPANWDYFYPNSSVVSADEGTLYVGMRWYVGEVDLRTKRVRFRVPKRAP